MCGYKYGEEIDYSISLLNVTDSIKLKEFDCDNFKLNYYIHNVYINDLFCRYQNNNHKQ